MLDNILDKDPVANEKATTPRSIKHDVKIFSAIVKEVISPKPTVVIVVTVK